MKLNKILLSSFLLLIAVSFAGLLPASAQTGMKDTLGVDFGEDFAIVVDFNVDGSNFDTFPGAVQVLRDLVNPSNDKVNPVDENPNADQEYFLAHFNTSGIHNSYFALNKIEQDLKISILGNEVIIGHINGSSPFQTLLQYYQYEGDDVFVANTFRGYMAYSTTPDDLTLDIGDDIYVGYTLVEEKFLSLLNLALANAPGNYDPIPEFGYEPLYESTATSKSFGMNYTNFFVVWQDTETKLEVPGFNTDSFKGVVTGGDIVAASLFDYLTFTYTIETKVSNATHTIVDVVTEYDIGPMKWLITKDTGTAYNIISTAITEINSSNSFNTPATQINLGLKSINTLLPDVSVTIPSLSFYTGEAVNKRIDASAVEGNADGFGIAVVTTTNVHRASAELTLPGASTNGQEVTIPLNFGGDNIFETSFVGKATYDRTFPNRTTETFPVYVTTKTMSEVQNTFSFGSIAKAYFKAQSLQTTAFTMFTASQLSPVVVASASSSSINMDVDSTAYLTFVQMPWWSGLEVTQDPTYSAVSLVGTAPESSDPSDTGINTSTTSPTTPVPGFEAIVIILGIIPLVFIKRRK
ncbi:MAG: hypothetical protein HeimC3_43130 [Candidatus Heimdallarchaeota archaeon LC_3]|nr:MAG: hypothetical protein HeimC3_43130 [Candidatus Heimdallarchaeota archaeon LC_3]